MIDLASGLKEFQEKSVLHLLDFLSDPGLKPTLVLKSPTGSGKTIMLIDLIDKYLDVNPHTCFVWFSPGQGDLEEQSKEKMEQLLPTRKTTDIIEILQQGFEAEQTAFINWERVTKKGNIAITESEQKNLFERIRDAKRNKLDFVLIIDEEHLNATAKANHIINAFEAEKTIRISATAKKDRRAEWYEISEQEVINSGLITRAMYINDGIELNKTYDMSTEHQILIDLAEEKRADIHTEYRNINRVINPLVIIQFPSQSNDLIKEVEDYLYELGVSYENGLLAKWLSEEKINTINIETNNAVPQYLIMKQAISTGWDCPRAKILVKLRDNMNEDFEVQTLGRLRRMPEAIHYNNTLLDYCFLYTFDEKYKNSVLKETNTFEVRRVFLKDVAKKLSLNKELRDLDFDIVGEKETLIAIHGYLVDKYNLTKNYTQNKRILETHGYIFGTALKNKFRQGKFITIEEVQKVKSQEQNTVLFEVDVARHGLELLHSLDIIKKIIGLSSSRTKTVLRHLFFSKSRSNYKLLKLSLREWTAFIINNIPKLREEFSDLTAQMNKNIPLSLPKTQLFKIAEEELYRIDNDENYPEELLRNAYKDYDSSMITSKFRSTSERLFENYCNSNKSVKWYYKNGDKGKQYFSVVYVDGIGNQRLFYPDYIVQLDDDRVLIIETKGGESMINGEVKDKNIDIHIENKFNAFNRYAQRENLEWAFVRDKNETLYFNNTKYSSSMSDSQWQPLKYLF